MDDFSIVINLVLCQGWAAISTVCSVAKTSKTHKKLAYRPSSFGRVINLQPFNEGLTSMVIADLLIEDRIYKHLIELDLRDCVNIETIGLQMLFEHCNVKDLILRGFVNVPKSQLPTSLMLKCDFVHHLGGQYALVYITTCRSDTKINIRWFRQVLEKYLRADQNPTRRVVRETDTTRVDQHSLAVANKWKRLTSLGGLWKCFQIFQQLNRNETGIRLHRHLTGGLVISIVNLELLHFHIVDRENKRIVFVRPS